MQIPKSKHKQSILHFRRKVIKCIYMVLKNFPVKNNEKEKEDLRRLEPMTEVVVSSLFRLKACEGDTVIAVDYR